MPLGHLEFASMQYERILPFRYQAWERELKTKELERLCGISDYDRKVTKHEVDKLLRDGADPCYISSGWTVLGLAAQSGQENIVEALADAGADINRKNPVGRRLESPLASAIIYDKRKAAEALIERGARINYKYTQGQKTPLFPIESAMTQMGCLPALMNGGASLDLLCPYEEGKYLTSPLMDCIKRHNLKHLKELLEYDADPNFKTIDCKDDQRLETPLRYALSRNRFQACKLLIEYGANINVLTKDEKEKLQKQVENYEELKKPSFPQCMGLQNLCRRFIRKSCSNKLQLEAIIKVLPGIVRDYVQYKINADSSDASTDRGARLVVTGWPFQYRSISMPPSSEVWTTTPRNLRNQSFRRCRLL